MKMFERVSDVVCLCVVVRVCISESMWCICLLRVFFVNSKIQTNTHSNTNTKFSLYYSYSQLVCPSIRPFVHHPSVHTYGGKTNPPAIAVYTPIRQSFVSLTLNVSVIISLLVSCMQSAVDYRNAMQRYREKPNKIVKRRITTRA